MKRSFYISSVLALVVSLVSSSNGLAQEPDSLPLHDSTLMERFNQIMAEREATKPMTIYLPDLPPTLEELAAGYSRPVVPFSSIVVPQLPKSIKVLPDGFRLGKSWSVGISNGQASNWGAFPNAYLDARTLSFPATGRGGAPRR